MSGGNTSIAMQDRCKRPSGVVGGGVRRRGEELTEEKKGENKGNYDEQRAKVRGRGKEKVSEVELLKGRVKKGQ